MWKKQIIIMLFIMDLNALLIPFFWYHPSLFDNSCSHAGWTHFSKLFFLLQKRKRMLFAYIGGLYRSSVWTVFSRCSIERVRCGLSCVANWQICRRSEKERRIHDCLRMTSSVNCVFCLCEQFFYIKDPSPALNPMWMKVD